MTGKQTLRASKQATQPGLPSESQYVPGIASVYFVNDYFPSELFSAGKDASPTAVPDSRLSRKRSSPDRRTSPVRSRRDSVGSVLT